MRKPLVLTLVAAASGLTLPFHGAGTRAAQEPQASQAASADDMAAMMDRMKRFTEPGAAHRELARFLGTWDTETRFFMAGQPTPPEKGRVETTWLMDGRWLQSKGTGTLMGRPLETFALLGYDNFKLSYVVSSVSTMDTAMHHAEGDMDPTGEALLLYGTLDEYLTGEHDKMVKTVWRFPSPDELVMEVHDLPIGEKNTKVVEIRYSRAK